MARLARPRLGAITLAFAAFGAHAQQGVRTEKNISLELADQIAAGAVVACADTAVDHAGGVCADTAGPHMLVSSERKARTSASAKNPRQAMIKGAKKNPAGAKVVYLPGFLLLGGGVPIKAGNEVIGAVGVGGAPGGQLDEQCANAALNMVKGALGA